MIQLSPLGGLAAAALLVAVLLGVIRIAGPDGSQPTADADVRSAAGEPTQFVLVAPEAASVAVVGDFNDWSFSATPLARQAGDGMWWVTLPLRPGRYRYAFVVDGTRWRSDPNAPAAEDEFGRPNSVVTIGGA
jgi:1,4-alpha-glucan branching enzyme